MSLKNMLIQRTVPSWPILGKTTAGVCPQEAICIPGAAHHLPAVRSKIPGLHLLLPLGRQRNSCRQRRAGTAALPLLPHKRVEKVESGGRSLPLHALSAQFVPRGIHSGADCQREGNRTEFPLQLCSLK